MIAFFKTILYFPLYNLLVFLTGVLPGADLGLAIIILTILVRLILFPLEHRRSRLQQAMKIIQPQIEDLKKKLGTDREKLARETFALYRRHGVNPFSTVIISLVQIPILLTLFFVFRAGLPFAAADLYSFVSLPDLVNSNFLGLIELTSRSIPLALFAGLTQFFQLRLSVPPMPAKKDGQAKSFSDDLARSMNINMRYFFPVMIIFISLGFPAALVLYWSTSNLFMIAHELFVRRRAGRLETSAKVKPV